MNVPLDGSTLERDNAWTSAKDTRCGGRASGGRSGTLLHQRASKIRLNMGPGDVVHSARSQMAVKSYTWWDHDSVNGIPGGTTGINLERSGI